MLPGRVHFLLFTAYPTRLVIVYSFFFFNVKCDILFWGRAAVVEVYPNPLSLTWAQEWPSEHILFVDWPPGLKLTLRLHLPGHISLCSWGRTSMLPWRGRLFIFLFKKNYVSCNWSAVAQLCPTLCDPVDCSPPGSSVHGDSPGKNTGVGCHALLQGIFPTQGLNPGFLHCRWILTTWATKEAYNVILVHKLNEMRHWT